MTFTRVAAARTMVKMTVTRVAVALTMVTVARTGTPDCETGRLATSCT